MPDQFRILSELCSIAGPVGHEGPVQQRLAELLRPYCSTVTQDPIGNLRATIEGTGEHYALVAHADEVGFLVSIIDERGFLRVKWNTNNHLPDIRLLPGQRVDILTSKGSVPGCFCVKTAHIAGPEGKARLPLYHEVFLDIGARSRLAAQAMGVRVGDPAVFSTSLERLGDYLCGKAIDDRVGLTVAVEVASRLHSLAESERPSVTIISTVMEEIGARGAAAVARDLDVDAVIVLEIGPADDYPGTLGEAGVMLGKGPVVVIKDSQTHYSHALDQRLFEAAEELRISVQRAVYHNYATDGFQMMSNGLPAAVVGVPCRYSHSSFETISPMDLYEVVKLVHGFLSRGAT